MDERREYPVPLASDEAIADFIARYGKPYDPETDDYRREPFIADLREGKNDPVYNVHSYHTKVPTRAIIQYILHYTEPGDTVLDPFCGTGMTGVAAALCAKPPRDVREAMVRARVGARRAILSDLSPAACHIAYNYCASTDHVELEHAFATVISKCKEHKDKLYGTEHYQPATGLYNPQSPEVAWRLKNQVFSDPPCPGSMTFELVDERTWELLDRSEVERRMGTEAFSEASFPREVSSFVKIPATTNYTIWSDVYRCYGTVTIEEPTGKTSRKTGNPGIKKVRRARGCGATFSLWDAAVEKETGKVNEEFDCPHCGQRWSKTRLKRCGNRPVVVNYTYRGLATKKKGRKDIVYSKSLRSERRVSTQELAALDSLEAPGAGHVHLSDFVLWTDGPQYKRNALAGRKVRTAADFYTKRNLLALSRIYDEIGKAQSNLRAALMFCFTSIALTTTRMYAYRDSRKGGILKGSLYLPSLFQEMNAFDAFAAKSKGIIELNTHNERLPLDAVFSCRSATDPTDSLSNCIDYIFTDPPFGSNIYYSEASLLWDAWLGRRSDREKEAVVHRKEDGGKKTIDDYRRLMSEAFRRMYELLKPGRYATIEFNNKDGRVFEAIKEAARSAGFEIENMVFLDKKHKTFKQIKGDKGDEDVAGHDVIFNMRKPTPRCVSRSSQSDGSISTSDISHIVAQEIRRHLQELPARIRSDPATYSDEHRTTPFLNTMLMTALIPRGVNVEQLNLPFIESVCSRFFKKVDTRWYLPEQAVGGPSNGKFFEEDIAIADETSAIQWLHRLLGKTPMRIGELRPHWMKATVKLTSDLSTQLERILRENFWLDRATRRWRLPTADELAQLHNVERERACHDAERFLNGKLAPPPDDRDVLSWMVHLYDAAALLEEEAQGLVEPGEEPAIPPEAIEYYRMMTRLLPNVLKENVDPDAYIRASRQCRAAARKLEEQEEHERTGDQAIGRQGFLFD